MEGVDEAIVGDVPGLGLAGNGVGLGVFGHEAFDVVAEDAVFPVAGGLVRIDRAWLGAVHGVERHGIAPRSTTPKRHDAPAIAAALRT